MTDKPKGGYILPKNTPDFKDDGMTQRNLIQALREWADFLQLQIDKGLIREDQTFQVAVTNEIGFTIRATQGAGTNGSTS